MKIIIVGGGFTGIQLAKKLIAEKNLVTLIDNDEEIIRHAANQLDCAVLQADGNSLEALESVGVAAADALVCVTESDEVNMITCSLVDAVYPKVLKIARVRNYAYFINTASAHKAHQESFDERHRPLYGIDHMVQPDVVAADKIVNTVKNGAINELITFDRSELQLLRVVIKPGSPLHNKMLKDARSLCDVPFLISYVTDNSGQTILPSGTTLLQEGFGLGVLLNRNDTAKILELCASSRLDIKKIVIVGAGKIGTFVAKKLFESTARARSLFDGLSSLFSTKRRAQKIAIIDSNEALTKSAADHFPDASVFCADATDESFLSQESITSYDLAICVTHNHEMNMVLASYLESLGVKYSIALVSNSAFAAIARKLGVDVPVPIKDVVVDSIMSHLRGKTVKEVHTITGSGLEIVECVIPKNSPVLGKRLRDISKPGQFLVLMIQKATSETYTIPAADTVFEVDDRVAIMTLVEQSTKTVALFGKK